MNVQCHVTNNNHESLELYLFTYLIIIDMMLCEPDLIVFVYNMNNIHVYIKI